MKFDFFLKGEIIKLHISCNQEYFFLKNFSKNKTNAQNTLMLSIFKN